MKLVVISGRSGSGKSTALHVLEDLGYYCIDNLPGGLLMALIKEMQSCLPEQRNKVAVSIDARNLPANLKRFPDTVSALKDAGISYSIAYLDADDQSILTRFSSTRRKHPLSSKTVSLEEAIAAESALLDPIAMMADTRIDTTHLTLHQLRDIVCKQVAHQTDPNLTLLFESFGFKQGVPSDADVVFDIRCLPNPYWDPALRDFRGLDQPVIEFMEQHDHVEEMYQDILNYLEKWLPRFAANNRAYMTVALGCTGGHHRSVYLANRLSQHFSSLMDKVQVRHRDLD